jgi:hypothetical protein
MLLVCEIQEVVEVAPATLDVVNVNRPYETASDIIIFSFTSISRPIVLA